MKVLAIIPARKGSKRLLGKNIKKLAGKELIAWTIEAALTSQSVDTVLVSTDCFETAEVAKKYGASVPFLRPSELSEDNSNVVDVVLHALTFYKAIGHDFTHIVLLQPTSPLRTAPDIDEAFSLLEKKKGAAVIAVCPVDHSPLWCNILDKSLTFDHFLKKASAEVRSQDLPPYFRVNGAVYIAETSELLKLKTFVGISNSFAYVMEREKSVDIDSEIDFQLAEFFLNRIND